MTGLKLHSPKGEVSAQKLAVSQPSVLSAIWPEAVSPSQGDEEFSVDGWQREKGSRTAASGIVHFLRAPAAANCRIVSMGRNNLSGLPEIFWKPNFA